MAATRRKKSETGRYKARVNFTAGDYFVPAGLVLDGIRVLVKHNDDVGPDHPGRPLPAWRAALDDDVLSNGFFELVNRCVADRSGD